MKKININHAFTCIMALVLSGICYAETYNNYICTVQCSPSPKEGGWVQIEGEPNARYTITTIGIEVKGVGLIVDWDRYFNTHKYTTGNYNTGYVLAKCESSNKKVTMYSTINHTTPSLSSLSCPKGKGFLLRFISPNDPDPDKYVFKYKMTAVQEQTNNLDTPEFSDRDTK